MLLLIYFKKIRIILFYGTEGAEDDTSTAYTVLLQSAEARSNEGDARLAGQGEELDRW
jgi:hypothetical protein